MNPLSISSTKRNEATGLKRPFALCAVVAILSGFCAVDAQAGLISFDEFAETESFTSESFSPRSEAGPSEQPAPEKPAPKIVLLTLGQMFALDAGGQSSMATSASGGSSPSPHFAVIETPKVSSGVLATYLTRESRALLPIPFLDGIFRPPRSSRVSVL